MFYHEQKKLSRELHKKNCVNNNEEHVQSSSEFEKICEYKSVFKRLYKNTLVEQYMDEPGC